MSTSTNIVFTIITGSVILLGSCCIYWCVKGIFRRRQSTSLDPPTTIYSVTMNGVANQNVHDALGELVRFHRIQTNSGSTYTMTDMSRSRQVTEGNINSGFSTENFNPPPSYESINQLPSYQDVMNAQQHAHAQLASPLYKSSSQTLEPMD